MKFSKPWYRKSRRAWFVTLNGKQVKLGVAKQEALDAYHKLMSDPPRAEEPKDAPKKYVVGIIQRFMRHVRAEMADDTIEWYRYLLQKYDDHLIGHSLDGLTVDELRPHQLFFAGRGRGRESSLLDHTCTKPDLEHIRQVERLIHYANQQGITVWVHGWWSNPNMKGSIGEEHIRRWCRYLVHRLGAYNVIWVLAGEYNMHNYGGLGLDFWKNLGQLIDDEDAYDPIIGADPTPPGWKGGADAPQWSTAEGNRLSDNGVGIYFCWHNERHVIRQNQILGNRGGGITGLGNPGDRENIIEDNRIAGNGGPGIEINGGRSSGNVLRNNKIENNSQEQPGKHPGIALYADVEDARRYTIEGNIIRDTQAEPTQHIGVEERHGTYRDKPTRADENVITGNKFAGHRDADVVLAGTDTRCEDNLGAVIRRSHPATGVKDVD